MGAEVAVQLQTGNSSQVVSSHLACPAQRSGRQECGYYGVTEPECRQRDCCWDSSVHGELFCFHKQVGIEIFAYVLPWNEMYLTGVE